MAGRPLADAFVVISPDTRLFRTMADAQIKKDLAGFNPKVRIGADTKGAQVAIASFQTRVKALSEQLSNLRADAKTKDAESKVAGVQARVLTLAKQMRALTMTADAKKLDAKIADEVAKLKGLQAQMSGLQADADTKAAAAKILALQAQAARLQEAIRSGKLKSDIDVRAARAKILSLDADVRALGGNARAVKLAADSRSILTQIEVVKASLSGLQAQARDIKLGTNLDPAKILASESALLGLEHIVEALGKKDVPEANTAMNAFIRSTRAGSTLAAAGWRVLTGHLTLFGGVLNRVLPKMFTSVAVWHLLADAVIETVAVWAPAIIAVTAFGVAGVEAGKEVYNRMLAVHTVMKATGQAVPPLTNSFSKLSDAVRPQVYQLFGDALVVMNKRGGAFNQVATQTGKVLDQLAARFVFAVTTGSGVNKFMEHAVQDVARLGDSIGNLGGIFGAVFKAVPGYAEILLSVGDSITKVLEAATRAAEPVIAVGLALHGFFIYGGTAVTVSLALIAGIVKLGSAFTKFNESVTLVGLNSLKKFGSALVTGVGSVRGYSGAILDLARTEGTTKAAGVALGDGLKALGKIPTTVWVLAAAAALVTLVHAIATSRDAAQQFNDTLQQTIQNAPLANVATTIQQAQVVTAARLATSTRQLNEAIRTNTSVNAGRAGTLNSNGTAIQNLDNATRHYAEGVIHLSNQQKLVTGRFSDLSKEFGGQTQALGALNAAGITTAQITDTNRDHWAQALIQVEATAAAYKAMGTQAGVLGNDLDVLGRTETDQYTATQKLNQAWSAFISDVTGTQGSFDTVAQGFFTLNDHAGKLTFSLGKLKVKYADQKAAIDSLTPAGVALNQAFTDQIGNIDKLFASWRTAGLAGNLFTEGVKAAISPLVKYAAGSREATAQLVALAQEAGYQGPISMAALTKWLGNTHGATQKLKNITDQATQQEALLTGAMQSQADFITTQLSRDLAQAVLAYEGVQKAVSAYGTAVARSGKNSDDAKSKLTTAVGAIVKSEVSLGDNAQQMAAVVAKTFGISMPAAIGQVKAAIGNLADKTLPGAKSQFRTFAEVGLDYAKGKANDLWNEIATKLGPKLDGLGNLAKGPAKAKFIDWAENGLHLTQGKARDLWNELVILQTHINNLHGKAFTVTMQANGFVKITEGKSTFNISQGAWNSPHAAGGLIQAGSGPTADDVPAMLSRGEFVQKAAAVSRYGVPAMEAVNKGQAVITYAAGGLAGPQHLAAGGLAGKPSTWPDQAAGAIESRAQGDVEKAGKSAMAAAVKAAIKLALSVGSGPAVLQYAMGFLHKVPYVWGGSTPSGWDCSGMVSYVYDHFKLFSGRTDAEGFRRWAKPSAPTPGGLAFYGSPAHHVGFVVDNNTLLSALGHAWGTTLSNLSMGDNSGYGIPPSGFGMAGAAGAGGSLPKNKLQELAFSLLAQHGWGGQWPAFDSLETREAGWNMRAVNPRSGAAGLAQFINGWSEYYQYGGNPNTGEGQLTAMMNYIAQRYGDPNGAWAHEIAKGFYARGGLVGIYDQGGVLPPGGMAINLTSKPEQVLSPSASSGMAAGGVARLASGGMIPLAKYLPQLKAAQSNEYKDYTGLTDAYKHDLKVAKTGSWTSGHRAGIKSEMATLAKRQSLEEAGYDNILHHGTAKANLSKLGTRLKDVLTTSRDKDLAHSHPSWTHGLQYWLGVLTHLSQAGVAPVYGGSQAKLQFSVWLAKLKATQAHETYDYRGLEAAFKTGLAHARKGTWLYANRKALGTRLAAVTAKQNAEAAAYNDLIGHSSGSVSDLDGLAGRITKIGSQASAEAGALQPSLLGHLPGGHPGWLKALQAQLKALTSLAAAPPYNPPWNPGNLGPSHTAIGGVLRFDTGRNVLPPGMSLTWNGTGRNEALSRTGAGSGPQAITLEFAGGGSDLEQLLFQIIRKTVRVRGGGNVQTAFGRG